jgi:signal transduction histidine kinase/ActR/RegA family two-component response regulator
VNPAASSIVSHDDILAIFNQLIVCHEPTMALPLLEALDAIYQHRLHLCLPPVHDSEPFRITDVAMIEAWLKRGEGTQPAYLPAGSEPIQIGSETIGLVQLRDGEDEPSVELYILASRLGVVLNNWQLHSLKRRAGSEKEILVRLCLAANAQQELQAVMAEAYDALHTSLQFNSFIATVYNPTRQMNVLSYIVDGDRVYVDNLVGPVPNGLTAYVLRNRRPLRLGDVRNEIHQYPEISLIRIGGDGTIRSWIGVPMMSSDGRAIGMLSLQHEDANIYSDHDQRFLEHVATAVAIAIEKAMLLQERDREIAALTAQTELSEALGRAHDVNTALESALVALEQSFSDQVYILFMLDPEYRISASLMKENGNVYCNDKIGVEIAPGSLSRYILAQPGPVLFNNEQEMHSAGISWNQIGDLDQPVTQAVIGAPIHAMDGSFMSLLMVQSYTPNVFDSRQAALLGSIARQVALVIENARLIEQDQRRLHELEQANRDLELAQHRVVEAERRRAIADIAAGVAHDFNNLLGAILGNAQLISFAGSLEEAQELAKTVEIAARDAATIVRRIQVFTRSHEAEERVPVDIHPLITSAVNIVRPRWRDEAHLRGITIDLSYELEPVDPVLGIEAELREVLVNLLINAVDAMTVSGPLIVGTHQSGEQVSIYVRDAGSGMKPAVLARAGQPFFTTKGSRGSGLGLAVSQGIVQRHGGDLVIESIEGQGTSVTMKLPSASPQLPQQSTQPVRVNRLGTIIVVDDEPHLRSVTRRILEHAGHRVFDFGSGPEAIEHLREHPADVLLTDLGLPGMGGWEIARTARAVRPEIQILMATGWGDHVAAEEAYQRGVAAVLSKPLDQNILLDSISQVLYLAQHQEYPV